MRIVRVLLALAILVLVAVCVQENAGRLTSLTLFGTILFSGVSVPLLILVSMLAGALLILPFFFAGRNRAHVAEKKRTKPGSGDGDSLDT